MHASIDADVAAVTFIDLLEKLLQHHSVHTCTIAPKKGRLRVVCVCIGNTPVECQLDPLLANVL